MTGHGVLMLMIAYSWARVEARLFASRCPEPVERLLLHGDGLVDQVIEHGPIARPTCVLDQR